MKFIALTVIIGVVFCVNAAEVKEKLENQMLNDDAAATGAPGAPPEVPTRASAAQDHTFPSVMHNTGVPEQKPTESPSAASSTPNETTPSPKGGCSHILGSVALIFVSGILHFL